MKRVAVINQKGGVGKTTTAVNLAVALSRRGRRVLMIDLDPQAHMTAHMGIDPDAQTTNVYTLLTRGHALADVRLRIDDRLHLLPSHLDLASAESELVSVIGRETILRDALLADGHPYDDVIIDCPPSLGILTLDGLCAANLVLIPMQAHFLALQGVSKLLQTVSLVQARINPELRVCGVLMCMHDTGTRLANEVVEDLKSFFNERREERTPWSDARVFDTVIRRNIKLAESPSHGLSVFDYAPKSHGAEDYARLSEELLRSYGLGCDEPALKVHLTELVPAPGSEAESPPTPRIAHSA